MTFGDNGGFRFTCPESWETVCVAHNRCFGLTVAVEIQDCVESFLVCLSSVVGSSLFGARS
jgi:hypothetical protein